MVATVAPTDIRARAAAAHCAERDDEARLGRDWKQRAARAWLREMLGVDPATVPVFEDDQFGDVYVVDGLEFVFESAWARVTEVSLIRPCAACGERFVPDQDQIRTLADLGRWLADAAPVCDRCCWGRR